jgi:hypothetical protein
MSSAKTPLISQSLQLKEEAFRNGKLKIIKQKMQIKRFLTLRDAANFFSWQDGEFKIRKTVMCWYFVKVFQLWSILKRNSFK